MYCNHCGKSLENGEKFCPDCGTGVEIRKSNFEMPSLPEEYKPISAWGYFGYQLLFALPIAGFILLIIFAVGGTNNINLRNFARSYFCMFLLLLIIILVLMLFGIGFFAAAAYN